MVDGRLIAISDVHLDTWRDSGEEKKYRLKPSLAKNTVAAQGDSPAQVASVMVL